MKFQRLVFQLPEYMNPLLLFTLAITECNLATDIKDFQLRNDFLRSFELTLISVSTLGHANLADHKHYISSEPIVCQSIKEKEQDSRE